MRWRIRQMIVLLCLPSMGHAYVNLKDSWSESGDYKMARQDNYPGGFSTNTITRAWDGTTIKLFGGKGELITWVTYLIGGNSDATNVMVKLSSFTGTGAAAGTGFSATPVSAVNAWDYTQRPYSLYWYNYVQIVGMSEVDMAWDASEYDQQQLPPRWQVPCTLNGNNDCIPNGGTQLWTNRADHSKFYPDAAIPIEAFTTSSFTVSASSSLAIGGEVYISTGLIANATYTATLTVTEGVTVSSTIPIALYIYNVVLPGTSTLPVIAFMGYADYDMRLTGTRFPANEQVDPYFTNHARAAAFVHRHKIIPIGENPTAGQRYPNAEYNQHLDGSGYKETYGLAWNTGPGYGMKDSYYMIGPYGGWPSGSWSTTVTSNGSTGFCDNISSWTASCATRGVTCYLYTQHDEAVASADETYATWMATAPSCASGSNRLGYFQTGTLPSVMTIAPDIQAVASTYWIGYASATWVSNEALYQQSSTHSAWGYNSGLGTDSVINSQEEGLGPREVMWGAYKTGQKGWFLWEINYWNDSNNGGQTQNGFNADTNNDNHMLSISKTFGYDQYPTTSASQGHNGFHFTNGDGVMLYPSSDSVNTSESYKFSGVIGSWKLNMLTRGIQDVDIIKLAYAVNPSSTTTIVNQQVQDVMYLRQCFSLGDCTYSYGVRPWSETLDSWDTARESLLRIAAVATPSSPSTASQNLESGISVQGGIQFK